MRRWQVIPVISNGYACLLPNHLNKRKRASDVSVGDDEKKQQKRRRPLDGQSREITKGSFLHCATTMQRKCLVRLHFMARDKTSLLPTQRVNTALLFLRSTLSWGSEAEKHVCAGDFFIYFCRLCSRVGVFGPRQRLKMRIKFLARKLFSFVGASYSCWSQLVAYV